MWEDLSILIYQYYSRSSLNFWVVQHESHESPSQSWSDMEEVDSQIFKILCAYTWFEDSILSKFETRSRWWESWQQVIFKGRQRLQIAILYIIAQVLPNQYSTQIHNTIITCHIISIAVHCAIEYCQIDKWIWPITSLNLRWILDNIQYPPLEVNIFIWRNIRGCINVNWNCPNIEHTYDIEYILTDSERADRRQRDRLINLFCFNLMMTPTSFLGILSSLRSF